MVRAKKRFGQHFLADPGIADKIVSALTHDNYERLLEVGPGTGILTERLVDLPGIKLTAIELDYESIAYLRERKPLKHLELIEGDFLKFDLNRMGNKFGIIGNFPYNISSQIFFKVLNHKDQVLEIVGMLQREVARRIASRHGNKEYGILSVLLQSWYDVELLFEVAPGSFRPPPKVMSSVVRLTRNKVTSLDCDEDLFRVLVKQGFQNRRKTLWNALKPINLPTQLKAHPFMGRRAEQLCVEDFVELTKQVEEWKKN